MTFRTGVRPDSRITVCLVALLLLLTVAIPVFAQFSTGSILGTVKDAQGGAVPGAAVTIRNTETGLTRTLTTGEDGAYRAPSLPVGMYSIVIEKSGFKTSTHEGLILTVTQEMEVNFDLEVGQQAQRVIVTGEAPQVETTSGSLGSLVDEQKIADLPLNGRNYIDLTLLQTGISKSTQHLGEGVWFSSNGAPPRSNNILLDGARLSNSTGTISASAGGNTLGVDGIREYTVLTDMFGAEYGLTMGSQVVMVSKGGANRWSGDVFEYLRNSALDAANYFDTPASSGGRRLPPFRRNNFGGSFGGPIKKDKAFFNAVYEGLRQDKGLTFNTQVLDSSCYNPGTKQLLAAVPASCSGAGAEAVNPTMAKLLNVLIPYPNIVGSTGALDHFAPVAADRAGENFGQIRFDQNFSMADSFFVRYTTDQYHDTSDSPFPVYGSVGDSWNHFVTIAENHIFSPGLLNTGRFSFSRTTSTTGNVLANTQGADLSGPGYSFFNGLPSGSFLFFGEWGIFGPTAGNTNSIQQNLFTGSDDVFYTKGRHALKFGFLVNRFDITYSPASQSANSVAGEVQFFNVRGLLNGRYGNYDAATVNPAGTAYTYNTIGLYAQDDFRVSSRLTLNLGLRYEFNTVPTEMHGADYRFLNIADPSTTVASKGPIMRNASLKNFSPRVGFAYDVTGNGTTSIRGGFGEYFDVGNIGSALSQHGFSIPPFNSFRVVNQIFGQFGPCDTLTIPFSFQYNQSTCPGAPPVLPSIHTLDYYSKQPHLLQYNLTVEHQLPWNMALSVGYVGSRGINLFNLQEENPNIPIPSSAANCVGPCPAGPYWGTQGTQPRYNPNIVTATMVTSAGDSWYNSLQANLNMRTTHGLQFQVAYTYSKSLDTAQAQAYVVDCFASTGSGQGIDPTNTRTDRGPSCFDTPHNLRLNFEYHLPNMKRRNFGAKVLNGWWVANILSIQSGYPFTLNTRNLISNNGVYAGDQGERPNVITKDNLAGAQAAANVAAAAAGVPAPTMQIYDQATVITGNVNHWFNPNMFTLVGPNAKAACNDSNQSVAPSTTYGDTAGFDPTCYFGFMGDASRNILRGPHLRNWDFSIDKDTALPFLGENGKLEFRVDLFNILNHPNFSTPNNTIYGAQVSNELPASPAFGGSAGVITSTASDSRQIQLALKFIF
jgi:hypothetical protein